VQKAGKGAQLFPLTATPEGVAQNSSTQVLNVLVRCRKAAQSGDGAAPQNTPLKANLIYFTLY